MLDDGSQPSLPTVTALTSRISESEAYICNPCSLVPTIRTGISLPYVHSNTLVKHPRVSDEGPPTCEGMAIYPGPNEEPSTASLLPWQSKILASFTMYGELSVACTSEEFAFVHTRLQREWTFNGGFVSPFTIMLLFELPVNSLLDLKLVALAA